MYLKRKEEAAIITTDQGFEVPNIVVGIESIIEVWEQSISVNCAYWVNANAMKTKSEPLRSGKLDRFNYSFTETYAESKQFIEAMNGNVISFIMDKPDFEGKLFNENWEVVQ